MYTLYVLCYPLIIIVSGSSYILFKYKDVMTWIKWLWLCMTNLENIAGFPSTSLNMVGWNAFDTLYMFLYINQQDIIWGNLANVYVYSGLWIFPWGWNPAGCSSLIAKETCFQLMSFFQCNCLIFLVHEAEKARQKTDEKV